MEIHHLDPTYLFDLFSTMIKKRNRKFLNTKLKPLSSKYNVDLFPAITDIYTQDPIDPRHKTYHKIVFFFRLSVDVFFGFVTQHITKTEKRDDIRVRLPTSSILQWENPICKQYTISIFTFH